MRAWINQHPNSLGLCRDYANTRKHATRDQPGALAAYVTRIEIDATGYTAKIGYRPRDQPTVPLAEVDALTLAEQAEQDWRDLLTRHGIAIPP